VKFPIAHGTDPDAEGGVGAFKVDDRPLCAWHLQATATVG